MIALMKKFAVLLGVFGVGLALPGENAQAAVITQWSFNGSTSTSGTSSTSPSNSPAPTTGSGTALTLGMTNPYNGGSQAADDYPSTKGTADPNFSETLWRVRANVAFANGSANQLPNGNVSTNGWALYNISGSAAHDGAPEYSQGIELDTSTVGYSNITFNFDWYSTTQGVRDMQFQYNLNVSNSNSWTNIGEAIGGPAGAVPDAATSNYVFVATPNDYYGGANPQTITVNLSSITGANNDPTLGVRLVSAFDDTGLYQDYVSATLNGGRTQLYNNSSGNWRLGNLTFQGSLVLNTSASGPVLTWSTSSGNWDTIGTNLVWSDSNASPAAYANGSYATFGNATDVSGTSTITISSSGVFPSGVAINNTTPGTGYAFVGGGTSGIGGTGALYLQPTNVGFVSLSGTNTYTGGTQVSGGTLIVAGDKSLGVAGGGAGGAVVIDNGSAVQLASGLSSGRLFEIGSNGGVIDTQSFSFSTSGSFIAGGTFTKLGSGTLTLNGAVVQLSGSTTLANGALVLSGTSGASLQGGATLNGNLVVSGVERVNFDSVSGAGLYGGSGQLQVATSGSIGSTFAKSSWALLSNSASGAVTAASGVVTSGGTISNNIVLNPNNLTFTKTSVTAAATPAPSSHAFIVGIGATKGGTLAFTGNISGNSDVVLGSNTVNGSGGAGTLFLSGNNSYAGTTIVDGNGVIQLGSTGALPSATDLIFGVTDASSATLDLNGFNQTINTLSAVSGASTITNSSLVNSATLSISGGATAKNGYNGSITGNLSLYKTGAGALTLTGSSTYSGATTIAQGALTVSKTSALGVGPLSVQSGASLIYSGAAVSLANNSASIVSGVSLSTGGAANYGTLALNSLTLSGGSVTYDFSSTQSDLITGSGVLDLTSATPNSIVVNLNTTGQTFNSYPLFQFGSLSGFSSADFTIGSGTTAGYTYGFTQNGLGEIDLTITGTGANNLPTRQNLTWAAGSGTWNTNPTNWVSTTGGTATTYYDGENVTFGEPTSNNSVVTVAGTAVTPLSVTISNSSNSYNFTGAPITGTTALYKTGAGLATLSTSNTYTGGTFITGGTLATGAAGDLSLGSTGAGVTLDMLGTLQTTTSNFSSSRAITVNAGGGTFAAAAGTSSVSGNLTIVPNGTFNSTGAGLLAFTGKVNSGAGSTISVQGGTLSIVPDNFTANGNLNIASSATLVLPTSTSPSAASGSVTLGNNTTINGNLVITNPLTLQFNGTGPVSGSGAIQFQNMQTPPAPTHFTVASCQTLQLTGQFVTQDIDVNIQLNSLNQPFFKTSVSQSGGIANGTGFILGNGTTDSFFSIVPGAGNTLNINGVISGSCDVQLGPIGGGGQGGSINLNNQNTYSGVTMFESGLLGTVTLGTSNALPTTTDLIFAPINGNSYQAKLDLNGNSQTVASMSYWALANSDSTSTAMQVVNGDPNAVATLTVSGAATPSRPFGGVLGDTNNHNLILVKDGPNTLWLNGNFNSYTGGTTVENGLLLLSPSNPVGGTPTGYGDVTVNGGTLQGTATIQGNLNVGAGGTVHPGLANSMAGTQPGTLAVAGNGTLSAGANTQFDLSSTSGLLALTGALNLTPSGGAVTFNFSDLGGFPGTAPLITYTSLTNSFSASSLSVGSAASGYAYILTGNAGEIDLQRSSLSGGTTSWQAALTTSPSSSVTFSSSGSKTITLDGNQSAGLLVFRPLQGAVSLAQGSGGSLSLGTAVAAPTINVNSGTVAISAPMTIEGSLGVTLSGASTLDLGNVSEGIAGSALTLNGNGHLVLTGADSYSGGTVVNSGTLIVDSTAGLKDDSSLTVGSAAASLFAPSAGAGASGAEAAGVAAVPEPGAIALLVVGGMLIAIRGLRRRKN
jgi:fibronectin-binding autotransporter adhesin